MSGYSTNITETVFHNICSLYHGGAISIFGNLQVNVLRVDFHNVSSHEDGGAIYFEAASLSLIAVTFYQCYSLLYKNNYGGDAIFSPKEASNQKVLKINDTLIMKCYYSKESPGDSVLIVYSLSSQETTNTNNTRNLKDISVIWGSCFGDILTNEALVKFTMIDESEGARAISVESQKTQIQLTNIVNNTCSFILLYGCQLRECFIKGNLNRNSKKSAWSEYDAELLKLENCWGDIENITPGSDPINMKLRTLNQRPKQTRQKLFCLRGVFALPFVDFSSAETNPS